jgi:hypothetical protein
MTRVGDVAVAASVPTNVRLLSEIGGRRRCRRLRRRSGEGVVFDRHKFRGLGERIVIDGHKFRRIQLETGRQRRNGRLPWPVQSEARR